MRCWWCKKVIRDDQPYVTHHSVRLHDQERFQFSYHATCNAQFEQFRRSHGQ